IGGDAASALLSILNDWGMYLPKGVASGDPSLPLAGDGVAFGHPIP
ncbi:hypothetical protein KFL_004520010, partial [Klebsormidium nitens]